MGCHGSEGHDGKEPRHEKKERLATSSGGDHVRNFAEKLQGEASPKNTNYKIWTGNFIDSERSRCDPQGGLNGHLKRQGEVW